LQTGRQTDGRLNKKHRHNHTPTPGRTSALSKHCGLGKINSDDDGIYAGRVCIYIHVRNVPAVGGFGVLFGIDNEVHTYKETSYRKWKNG